MKPTIKLFIWVLVVAAGTLSHIIAQDFEVAPVLVSFDANPGEVQSQKLTIRNHSNERQRFLLTMADYISDEKGTRKSLEAGSTDRSLINLLTINPSFIDLNPNESAEVDLNISVPQTFFKTCWGMVLVEVAREQTASGADKQLATGVLILPRITVLVKQSPNANQNFQGKVTGLTEVSQEGKVFRTFEAVVSNTGDKILEAKVFLALANLATAEEQSFKPTNVTIYPGQDRRVQLSLPVNPEKGTYAVAFLMDYGKRSALEGAQIMLEIK